jgi:hypothetical protein
MNSGALTAPVSQSFSMPTSTIWKENGTSIFARGKSEPSQSSATISQRIIVGLAKAIALAPIVATGAVTMLGTSYSQIETASTAPEYFGQTQASIVAQHLFSISIQSRMVQTIDGLATALHKLVWELSTTIVKYDSLGPGLQLTEDKSLILALGSKDSDSVMVEFFYDADTSAFENEASFIGRKAGKLTAEVIAKLDASTKIAEFLA